MELKEHVYNGPYAGEHLNRVAFPLGGIGAGMICLEGTGALSHVSVRGHPDTFNEPLVFAALTVKGETHIARVLEGPVPMWKAFGPPGSGTGSPGKSYGFPRFDEVSFEARFPFALVKLNDPKVPLDVELTGWSPFVPGNADDSSLPVAALEYRFTNPTDEAIDAVFSFHARNFMSIHEWSVTARGAPDTAVLATENGFVLWQEGTEERPWDQGAFSASVDSANVRVNCVLFRGGWFDPLTVVWRTIAEGMTPGSGPVTEGEPSPGGSLYVPFGLEPGQEKIVRLRLAWHVPDTGISATSGELHGRVGKCEHGTHKPWYAGVLEDIEAVNAYWRENYDRLREETLRFSECFYDTTLPPEVVEAVAANLTILKSPTVLRQVDGRLWGWEGCFDSSGSGRGSCTHVWNYAQALPHLFPGLERSLRQTEFNENQDERGHQNCRASLPIRTADDTFEAAADGQLGGIIKVHRDWRISGDTEWLRELWPKVKQSLDYCIETWDPAHQGTLEEPHLNTYDVQFWGADPMCTSIYLGALKAAVAMAEAVGDDVPLYAELLEKGRSFMESELWNDEYFIQRTQWQGLRVADPTDLPGYAGGYSPEAIELLQQEGPKYQYGSGCLSDGVLGAWFSAVGGVGEILDPQKVASHLLAVHRYNLKKDLTEHANPQRPGFALGGDGGLLVCTWPRGGRLTLPVIYSDEVFTGVEYQVASHLMLMGYVEEGLEVVRTCRDRYHGRVRNPFNEYEAGHWYARAMASYGLLQGLAGAWFDAVNRVLYLKPRVPGDFRAFLCTATGYGTVGVQDGQPFVEVCQGAIPYERIVYEPSV